MKWDLSHFFCQSWVWSQWALGSLKLSCPQSRDQNCDPSPLLSAFLHGKALWEPRVPLKSALILQWMNPLVLKENLNVNCAFPDVPNEVYVLRKAGISRSELDFEDIISSKSLAPRLSIPAYTAGQSWDTKGDGPPWAWHKEPKRTLIETLQFSLKLFFSKQHSNTFEHL